MTTKPRAIICALRLNPSTKLPMPKSSAYPTRKFTTPQTTLITGDDSPPGLAKGVRNFYPDMPCMKWGIPLAKRAPAKKLNK